MLALLTFRLGEETYGLEIDRVQEVLLSPRLHPVPRAPRHLLGALNLHGSPRAVLDLPGFLGFGAADRDARIVALTPASSGLAFAVTRLGSIRSLAAENLLPAPEAADPASCVRAVLPLEEGVINLLHLERLLQRLEDAVRPAEMAHA